MLEVPDIAGDNRETTNPGYRCDLRIEFFDRPTNLAPLRYYFSVGLGLLAPERQYLGLQPSREKSFDDRTKCHLPPPVRHDRKTGEQLRLAWSRYVSLQRRHGIDPCGDVSIRHGLERF